MHLLFEGLIVDSHVLNSVYMDFICAILLAHFEMKNPAKPTGCEKGDGPNEYIAYCQDIYFYILMFCYVSVQQEKRMEILPTHSLLHWH
jgi:hypothetical protein